MIQNHCHPQWMILKQALKTALRLLRSHRNSSGSEVGPLPQADCQSLGRHAYPQTGEHFSVNLNNLAETEVRFTSKADGATPGVPA